MLPKKQLEVVEAKYAMQAEDLRQVREEPGIWFGGSALGVSKVWACSEGWEGCVLTSLIKAVVPQGAQRTEEAWASFQEQSGVLQVRLPRL